MTLNPIDFYTHPERYRHEGARRVRGLTVGEHLAEAHEAGAPPLPPLGNLEYAPLGLVHQLADRTAFGTVRQPGNIVANLDQASEQSALMNDSRVIGDIGGGVPGSHWIDLAYSEEDYIAWHQNVTLYFLTPVPETILWPLP